MNDDDFNETDEEFNSIVAKNEDGTEERFSVIESCVYNDINYLLVIGEEVCDEDEVFALILKEINVDDSETIFEVVDDDDEIEEVYKLFQDNDDYSIEF